MLVLAGKPRETRYPSVSFLENPSARVRDRNVRRGWVRAITLHTTRAIRTQPILEGFGKGGRALATIAEWNRSPRDASAHLVVDRDGVVYQTADLVNEETWHAETVNPVTIGIEIEQGSDGSLYRGQLGVTVALCNDLTAWLGIQRQIPDQYRGRVARIASGGANVVGLYGHRDQADPNHRGPGDPGDAIFDLLAAEGYERFNFAADQDLATWRVRQEQLGMPGPFDGIAGRATVEALRAHGYADGLYVQVKESGTVLERLIGGTLLAALLSRAL
jgi:hypothetical protein